MPEDPTIKLTDFDCIVGDHHLQMLKAALPYLQVSQQRFLSFSIKFQELQHTMSLLHNEDNAALGICSLPEEAPHSTLDMLEAIKPYGSTDEQSFIDLICKAGVDSLKIEGRAKTFYYVASVTVAYRKALDAYLADPANDNFELPPEVYAELTRTSHRHYSPGFYFGREQAKQATDSATYIREWEFVGTVDSWENGIAHCQQRGKWSLGDTLEALCPDGRSIPLTPEWIENETGERVESTPHAMEKYTMPTPELPPMSLLRRKTV